MPTGGQGGPTGTSKANVAEVFSRFIQGLREHAKIRHNALQGKHQHEWYVPEGVADLLDIESLHGDAFDRDSLNEMYDEVMADVNNAGTIGDVIAVKLQLDYMAAAERAFRARHSTVCRSMCLASARQFGQGQGSIWSAKPGGVEDEVASFVKSGSTQRSE